MAPLALVMMLSLLAVCWFAFPDKNCSTTADNGPAVAAASGLELSGLYIVFLFALELKQELAGVLLVAAGFVVLAQACW
jgi:hypothetical protein